MKRRSGPNALRLGMIAMLCCASLALWGSARMLAERGSAYTGAVAAVQDIPKSSQSPSYADAALSLRSHQGVVCVYQGALLLYETDIPVDSLPEADRKLLSVGINVRNELELQRFLEDFGS